MNNKWFSHSEKLPNYVTSNLTLGIDGTFFFRVVLPKFPTIFPMLLTDFLLCQFQQWRIHERTRQNSKWHLKSYFKCAFGTVCVGRDVIIKFEEKIMRIGYWRIEEIQNIAIKCLSNFFPIR